MNREPLQKIKTLKIPNSHHPYLHSTIDIPLISKPNPVDLKWFDIMCAEIIDKFNVNIAPRQFADRLQQISNTDDDQLTAIVNEFFYLSSGSSNESNNRINIDEDNIMIPLPTKGGMSLMIRICHKAKHDFYTLVLNPC